MAARLPYTTSALARFKQVTPSPLAATHVFCSPCGDGDVPHDPTGPRRARSARHGGLPISPNPTLCSLLEAYADNVVPCTNIAHAVADADFILEAVPERLDVKRAIYEGRFPCAVYRLVSLIHVAIDIARHASADAIVGTMSLTMSITELSKAYPRAQVVLFSASCMHLTVNCSSLWASGFYIPSCSSGMLSSRLVSRRVTLPWSKVSPSGGYLLCRPCV